MGNALQDLNGGAKRILFVDDEDSITILAKRALGRLGYQVTTTTDSFEAMALFRLEPEAFDIVITDYTMPRMNGENLARQMLSVRPNIPIILCSGHNEMMCEDVDSIGVKGFVTKPFNLKDLAQLVRMTLDCR